MWQIAQVCVCVLVVVGEKVRDEIRRKERGSWLGGWCKVIDERQIRNLGKKGWSTTDICRDETFDLCLCFYTYQHILLSLLYWNNSGPSYREEGWMHLWWFDATWSSCFLFNLVSFFLVRPVWAVASGLLMRLYLTTYTPSLWYSCVHSSNYSG